jgi:hypothetical protein
MERPEIDESRSRVGRPPLPLGLRRDQSFRVAFTFHDAADIREIAAAWGVAPGVALWAVVMSQLARWRRIAPDYGRHGLAIAGGPRVLREKCAEARDGASDGE